MKLIIQIPCYNEEKTLHLTYMDLPKQIQGIDDIEVLVIDDGSSDKTAELAKTIGVNHIIRFKNNKGLAKAFEAGIHKALELGADIIVNTDGDNQYSGADIENLVRPILNQEADVVIGDRQTNSIPHFSFFKKRMQKFGSFIIRKLSKTDVKDVVSGFRAYNRETAMKINIATDFSYTIENIIQLGFLKAKVISVPIKINKELRKSRLFKNTGSFISQQLTTIIRAYANYKAIRVFTILGILIMIPGIAGFIRFLYFYFTVGGAGHIQSLIFSTAFLNGGLLILMIGIIADLISTNRKLLEKLLEFNKKDKWNKTS
ncbi:MAG: glycosyltransferase family 2 protein [Bacteroidota bacterium]|nr:glycosyltransferase family 2 protein [Bacteroidota bacterium]